MKNDYFIIVRKTIKRMPKTIPQKKQLRRGFIAGSLVIILFFILALMTFVSSTKKYLDSIVPSSSTA